MRKNLNLLLGILSLLLAVGAICCFASCGSVEEPLAETSGTSSAAVSLPMLMAKEPQEYFQNNKTPDKERRLSMIGDICETVTHGERFFSTKQKDMEEAGVIPKLDDSYQFTCGALYEDDGQVRELNLNWTQAYVTSWGEGEYHLMVSVEKNLESFPNVDAYAEAYGKTVTQQAGTEIAAVGTAEMEKCLTFQLGNIWYRVYGSEEIPVEDVVAVMEHFLQHPIEMGNFAREKGDEYTWAELSGYPDVFAGYYPVDSELCPTLIPTASEVLLQNDVPVIGFFRYYDSDIVDRSTITGWWIYQENPDHRLDPWELSNCAGDMTDLTEEDLKEYWKKGIILNQHCFVFTWDGYQIAVNLGLGTTSDQMWQILQELQGKKALAEN